MRTKKSSLRTLTPEGIEEFLDHLDEKGCAWGSLEHYRSRLNMLLDFLPEDKRLGRDTLPKWRKSLIEQGYSVHTVNSCIYIANSYLNFAGLREYQMTGLRRPESAPAEEMSRSEYLRLLSTARLLGKESVYLLVKLFASTGLSVQDLPRVTVEAAQAGRVELEEDTLRLPECLREELLSFAQREGRVHGPIFVTQREAHPLGRTVVTGSIRQLCAEAQVPVEKGSPRYLRRLYQATRREIESNVSVLIQKEQERLLETEQKFIGWEKSERYGAS